VAPSETGDAISIIQAAVRDGVQVEFDYLNARGDDVHRRVDPLRVESVDSDWYLRGWCHLRQAVRTFRLDRMGTLHVTDTPADAPDGDVVLPDSLFEPSSDSLSVVVELPASALPLIADYGPIGTTPGADGDLVHATLRVAHYHGLKRLVAGLAGVVRVVEPAEARQIVAEWAAAGLARYDESSGGGE
jgi:proteasome accessory factor C